MKASPSASEKQGLEARQVALGIIKAILEKRRPFEDAFSQAASLPARDRHLVQLLVFTLLRHLGQIDALIANYCEKPPQRDTLQGLRLGVVQLVLLKMPAHAVVDTAVELVRAKAQQGFINAVLRRIVRESPVLPPFEASKHIPNWLWEGWRANYGEATAQAVAAACQQEPSLDITVASDAPHWAERLGATLLPQDSLRLTSSDVAQMEGFSEGQWWVQDAAAALPVTLLPDIQGKRVLDVCAAPGGKTAQLATRGASVTALDRSASRMKRLEENKARLKLQVEVVVKDALEYQPSQLFPIVLLDVPCSATGTLRRHPDLPYIKSLADLESLARLQAALLDKAADWLEPGGLLLYCTCSLQPEEGEQQIEALLARDPRWRREPVAASELPESLAPALSAVGEVRLLPSFWADKGGMDGFFISRLRLSKA